MHHFSKLEKDYKMEEGKYKNSYLLYMDDWKLNAKTKSQ
jgi:hypothetical protein